MVFFCPRESGKGLKKVSEQEQKTAQRESFRARYPADVPGSFVRMSRVKHFRHALSSPAKLRIWTLQIWCFQEWPRQTKPKKGQFMNFFWGHSGTKVRDVNRGCFPKEKHQNSQKWAKFMNFSVSPFFWFGLPGRLLMFLGPRIPEGPTIKKKLIRSKFLIPIEIFDLARKFQSRRLDFPTKNRAAVGGSLENFILARNFQSRSKSRMFLIFGPTGIPFCATGPLWGRVTPFSRSLC